MIGTSAVRTVTKIEANPLLTKSQNEFVQKKVAAYCRVSTDDEEQLTSYESQIAYYTETIAKNPNWQFVDIYADEGITGTATKKRKDFMRLMRDCEKGKVDLILTKSISRFARNTVDSLSWVRKLRSIGVGVYFEEQGIDSLKVENEMLIGLFSVIAQAESENISSNVRWGIRQRMKTGVYLTNFNCFGYRKGADGIPVIVPEEAKVVKMIFDSYMEGNSVDQIKAMLESKGIATYTGKNLWAKEVIRGILTNEKYAGDLLLQKTFISDCINKKTKKNRGELAKYLINNNHPAIIDRELYNMVQVEISRRSNTRKKSDLAITEQGKYSGKYALSELLVCGVCGSHYRRTYKVTRHGKPQYVWRCINRIENGTKYCKDAVGAEEKKLHAAICRCLSKMMTDKDEVIEMMRSNLQYAISGDNKTLEAYAIENQIKEYEEQVDTLMEMEMQTTGDTEKYETEIIKLYEKIGVLREQLELAKSQISVSENFQAEVERVMQQISQMNVDSFTEYDDTTVRRLVECIRVMNDRRIVVILKGGMQAEEEF